MEKAVLLRRRTYKIEDIKNFDRDLESLNRLLEQGWTVKMIHGYIGDDVCLSDTLIILEKK